MKSKIFNRILEVQFIVCWLMAVVIPKSYFKTIFVSEIILFAVYTGLNGGSIYRNLKSHKLSKAIFWLFISFFVVAAFMYWLSFKNLTGFWHLDYIFFERKYVNRHFMVIAELFLSIGLSLAIFRSNKLFHLKKKHLLIGGVVVGIIMVYNQSYVIFLGGLFVAIISLLAVKMNNKLITLLIPLVMISHAAYEIAAGVMLFLIFMRAPLRRFFSHNTTKKIVLLLVLFILVIYFGQDSLYNIIKNDQNSLWRLLVWKNEIQTLAKTWFTGVGFGTSYVTADIYTIVNNSNMYMDSDGTIYERLFLVANHNSFLNMFYRMGLLGGGLFLALNIVICSTCMSFSKEKTKWNYEYQWWAFTNYVYNLVIIALNPGMEMMQFAINYTFSLGIILSVILKANVESINTAKKHVTKSMYRFTTR